MIRTRLPQHLACTGRPASDGCAVRPSLRIRNAGGEAIGARGGWREGTGLRGRLRNERTCRNLEPVPDVVWQVGVPSSFDLGGLDLESFHFHLHGCPSYHRAVLVHHEHPQLRWRTRGPHPLFLPQAHVAIAPSIAGRCMSSDIFATVIPYGALDVQLAIKHLRGWHSKGRLERAIVVQAVLDFVERFTAYVIGHARVGSTVVIGVLSVLIVRRIRPMPRGSDGEVKTSGLGVWRH